MVQSFSKRGFTLVECILALAIFSLVAASIVALVRSSLQSSSELHAMMIREQQLSGVIGLLQRGFRSLPSSAVILARPLPSTQDGNQFLFGRAPGLFKWAEGDVGIGTWILTSLRQPNGSLGLVVYRVKVPLDFTGTTLPEFTPDKDERPLMLISDIRKMEWSFYDSRVGDWVPEWIEVQRRPDLIRLRMELMEGKQSEEIHFWLPPLVPPPLSVGGGG